MLFKDALEQIQSSKAFCRAAWTLEDGYVQLMPGMKHVWKVILNPAPNAGNYIFSVEDLLADDWKEFEMPKEVIVEVAA